MPDPTIQTLLLVPTHAEAKPLARALRLRRQGLNHYANDALSLHVIGIRARHLPDVPRARRVLLAGVAGGLDPSLHCGDVIIEGLRPLPEGSLAGSITCAETPVCDPTQKADLFALTRAAAVDMESTNVRSRYPSVIHVRAILDPATELLPKELLTLVDPNGRTRPAAVASLLFRQPTMIPTLLRIGRAQTVAMRALTRVIHSILNDPPTPGAEPQATPPVP